MKIVSKAYKFRFYPNKELISYLSQSFGCSRFIYNKVLDINKQLYEHNQTKFSNIDRLNLIPSIKQAYNWLETPSSIILQQSVRHLNESYSRFFSGTANYPQFKKKFDRNSFTITGKNSIHFELIKLDNKEKLNFYLPKFKQPLNIKLSRKFDYTKVSSITVSKEPSGHYFISFLVQEEISQFDLGFYEKVNTNLNNDNLVTKEIIKVNNKIGIDVGIESTVTTYNGNSHEKLNLPKELLKSINQKIIIACKNISRKSLGSRNRHKAKIKLAKLYQYRTNLINDFYHKLSHDLIKNNRIIHIEDLDIVSMKSKKDKDLTKPTIKELLNPDFNKFKIDHNVEEKTKLKENEIKPIKLKSRKNNYSKLIQVVAWGKFKNCLEYKSNWHDRTLVKVDQFYPSSKKCSNPNCTFIHNELNTKIRQWICPQCGTNHDRDINASINIFNYEKKEIIKNITKHKVKKSDKKLNSKDLNKNQVLNQNKVLENNSSNVNLSRDSDLVEINKPKIKLDVNNILNTYAKLNSAVGATVDACEESQLISFNKDSMKQESLPFRAR